MQLGASLPTASESASQLSFATIKWNWSRRFPDGEDDAHARLHIDLKVCETTLVDQLIPNVQSPTDVW